MSEQDVLGLRDVDGSRIALVGGKGAHLGALSGVEGVRVPDGFCVTTQAFRRVVARAPGFGALLDELAGADPDDREAIGTLSAEVRRFVEGVEVVAAARFVAEITSATHSLVY